MASTKDDNRGRGGYGGGENAAALILCPSPYLYSPALLYRVVGVVLGGGLNSTIDIINVILTPCIMRTVIVFVNLYTHILVYLSSSTIWHALERWGKEGLVSFIVSLSAPCWAWRIRLEIDGF